MFANNSRYKKWKKGDRYISFGSLSDKSVNGLECPFPYMKGGWLEKIQPLFVMS
jgi:hypothetical protein